MPSWTRDVDDAGAAEPGGTLGDRVQHALKVRWRGGDDPQNLGRDGLLLQRLRSSRLRCSSSAKRRAFSMAMAAWWANVSRSAICSSENGRTSTRRIRIAPRGSPWARSGVASVVRWPKRRASIWPAGYSSPDFRRPGHARERFDDPRRHDRTPYRGSGSCPLRARLPTPSRDRHTGNWLPGVDGHRQYARYSPHWHHRGERRSRRQSRGQPGDWRARLRGRAGFRQSPVSRSSACRQLSVPLLRLGEQPGVLDGDGRLGRERLQQRDFADRRMDRTSMRFIDDDANGLASAQERAR